MDKHKEQDWYDPNPEIERSVYIPFTCTTCGIERDIIDFYDGIHSVNGVHNGQDYGFVVDHGELAQKQSTQDILEAGI